MCLEDYNLYSETNVELTLVLLVGLVKLALVEADALNTKDNTQIMLLKYIATGKLENSGSALDST